MFSIQYNNKNEDFTRLFGFYFPASKKTKNYDNNKQTLRDLAIGVCYYRLHADFVSNSSLHFLN